MIYKKFLISIIFIFIFIYSGCGMSRIALDNLTETIFESPKEIKNKIKDPVKNDSTRLAVLWSGHSTVLIQIYDKVIITDPFLTERLMGFFERKTEAGLDIDRLTKLDMILVSHTHMDHYSFSSVGLLEDKFPGTDFVFPKGLENYLPNFDLNMHRVGATEPNSGIYMQPAAYINDITIRPVYAVHSGGRYMLDTYTWKLKGATGYIIQYKDVTIYFAGDTGYDEKAFKEIGKHYNVDLALIPIGPCRECEAVGFWHHTSSSEALMLFKDLGAKTMIPIHYGSLKYVRDPDQPLYTLKELLNNTAAGFNDVKEKVIILDEGQQIVF